MRADKIRVGEMHSDLEQEKRDDVMLDFKAGRINVLVATDIVSRGIDIDDIEMVVNYDVPSEPEDYVHRIGRTARADADGKGVTFISEKEKGRFRRIESLLEAEVPKGTVPEELGETPSYTTRYGRTSGSKDRKRYNIGAKTAEGANVPSEETRGRRSTLLLTRRNRFLKSLSRNPHVRTTEGAVTARRTTTHQRMRSNDDR